MTHVADWLLVQWMAYVAKHGDIDADDAWLLLAIVSGFNRGEQSAHLGVRELASRCRRSQAWVIRHLASLERGGHIVRTRHTAHSRLADDIALPWLQASGPRSTSGAGSRSVTRSTSGAGARSKSGAESGAESGARSSSSSKKNLGTASPAPPGGVAVPNGDSPRPAEPPAANGQRTYKEDCTNCEDGWLLDAHGNATERCPVCQAAPRPSEADS